MTLADVITKMAGDNTVKDKSLRIEVYGQIVNSKKVKMGYKVDGDIVRLVLIGDNYNGI